MYEYGFYKEFDCEPIGGSFSINRIDFYMVLVLLAGSVFLTIIYASIKLNKLAAEGMQD